LFLCRYRKKKRTAETKIYGSKHSAGNQSDSTLVQHNDAYQPGRKDSTASGIYAVIDESPYQGLQENIEPYATTLETGAELLRDRYTTLNTKAAPQKKDNNILSDSGANDYTSTPRPSKHGNSNANKREEESPEYFDYDVAHRALPPIPLEKNSASPKPEMKDTPVYLEVLP
jgi:hypothetical protein